MTKRSIILAALALLGLTSAPALAQTANKTWVSSASGNDTGTCQFVAPCKTFAYAITQTAAGGELDVKDSGSYGIVTITKAINIVGVGVLAAVAVPSGATGITVNAGANDKVVLQGLVIDGHGVGNDGIDFNSGMSLTVDSCHIRDVVNNGISLQPEGAQSYYVSDTKVTNAGNTAIIVLPSRTAAKGSLINIDIHDNKTGVSVGYSTASLINSAINGNNVGILAEPNGEVVISQNTIAFNGLYGIQLQSGGVVSSYGDNTVIGNATYGQVGSVTKE